MITLHHLNQSRSIRILWLLEEIGIPYQVVAYQRRQDNFLAPDSLKAIHPLGKSPLLEEDGHVLAESGAMVEWLIERHAPHLAPAKDSADYADYLQWIHFAESSMMLPLLLRMLAQKDPSKPAFVLQYAQSEADKVLNYLNEYLQNKRYLVADKLSGADFMMVFVLSILDKNGQLATYPHIESYARQLFSLDSWQRAAQLEAQYSA